MKHFIKRQNQMSERMNTLALLYRYSTLRFADNIQSQSINGRPSYTYSSFRTRCDAISEMLENQGIGFGDRVAILSGNKPNWGIAFFAATAFGRIAVPILPESSENEIRNILEHSEAKAIFVSQRLLPGIKGLKGLTAIDIDTFTILNEPDIESGRRSSRKKPLPDDVAAIIYTSGTTGTPAYGTKVRLAGTDPNTGTGEIQCKGENVMLGYYKDPERTKAAFTDDGWFRTKDLACVDSKGRFSIKGRLNTVILGPSGENIYPEEIENVINGMAEVEESLVIQSDGRLVALIRLKEDFSGEIDGLKKGIMNFVNRQVSRFSRIAEVRFVKEAFEKTATHKIRRMKYCTA